MHEEQASATMRLSDSFNPGWQRLASGLFASLVCELG